MELSVVSVEGFAPTDGEWEEVGLVVDVSMEGDSGKRGWGGRDTGVDIGSSHEVFLSINVLLDAMNGSGKGMLM